MLSINSNPLVSAIIPTYNREKVISNAVDSILKQTYENIEIIVVDDGSRDSTHERLAKYADKISVIAQKNAGPAAARNRGIKASRGQFIAFLDSDDEWLPNKVEQQVSLLRRAGNAVPCCLCNIRMRWDVSERESFDIAWLKPSASEGIWVNVDEVLATRFVLFNQGIMIRREAIEKIGGFDESLRLLEDHELALRLSLEGPWAFIREPLVVWHETAGSLYHTAHSEELHLREIEVLEKHLASLPPNGEHRSVRTSVTRTLYRARRMLSATKMSSANNLVVAMLGRSLAQIERYRSALVRRSPQFPKMKIVSLMSPEIVSTFANER